MPIFNFFSMALGAAVPVFLPALITPFDMGFLIVFMAIFGAIRYTRVIAFFISSVVLASLVLNGIVNGQLPHEFEEKDLSVKVEVIDFPKNTSTGAKFIARIHECPLCANLNGSKIRLNWRGKHDIRLNDQYKLTVRLKRPRGFANPKGFDYQGWLLSNGIQATGYVKNNQSITTLSKSDRFIGSIRLRLYDRIVSSHVNHQGLILALTIGNKTDISSDLWHTLTTTGTVHLFVISGLHIGLIAGVAFFLTRLFCKLFPFSILLYRALPSLVSVSVAISYSLIAGFSLPTQRALVFVILFNLAYILGRKVNSLIIGLIAVTLIVLVNPLSPLQNGFWLSFIAVFSLLFVFSLRSKRLPFIQELALSQWIIYIALFFPLILLGVGANLISPLVNFIVVPIFSFFLVPLVFVSGLVSLVSPSVGIYGFKAVDIMLSSVINSLMQLAPFNYHLLLPGIPVNGTIILGVGFLVVLLLLPRQFRLFPLGGILLISLLVIAERKEESNDVITVLDVGQGLAVIGHFNENVFVFDTGAKYSEEFDIGKLVILPYMESHNLNHISYLMVSHSDLDHAGGLDSVLSQTKVEQLYYNNEQIYGASQCDSNLKIENDEFRIRGIWPDKQYNNHSYRKSKNNSSCVVLFERKGFKLLLTGDIEKDVEEIMIKNSLLPENIDVLIAPHHGSKTSSSLAMITYLNPKHVIFSAGYKNRFGHPANKVVQRYAAQGAETWNTAVSGAVTVFNVSNAYKIESERQKSPKPWYSNEN